MNTVNSTSAYEWIFSGIGVAVVSWLGTWAYRRYHKLSTSKEHSESSSQVKISDSTVIGPVAGRDISIGTFVQQGAIPEQLSDEYRSTPTMSQIDAAIGQAPLYLRKSVASSFSDLKVHWQMQVRNIQRLADGQIEVVLGDTGRASIAVASVKLEDYPILKTIHGGEPVEVIGTIDWVQENALVHLRDAKLKFPS
jgi:hypothetical protein